MSFSEKVYLFLFNKGYLIIIISTGLLFYLVFTYLAMQNPPIAEVYNGSNFRDIIYTNWCLLCWTSAIGLEICKFIGVCVVTDWAYNKVTSD
jgi:hypothetical protein